MPLGPKTQVSFRPFLDVSHFELGSCEAIAREQQLYQTGIFIALFSRRQRTVRSHRSCLSRAQLALPQLWYSQKTMIVWPKPETCKSPPTPVSLTFLSISSKAHGLYVGIDPIARNTHHSHRSALFVEYRFCASLVSQLPISFLRPFAPALVDCQLFLAVGDQGKPGPAQS